jgi:hypothetical protein
VRQFGLAAGYGPHTPEISVAPTHITRQQAEAAAAHTRTLKTETKEFGIRLPKSEKTVRRSGASSSALASSSPSETSNPLHFNEPIETLLRPDSPR